MRVVTVIVILSVLSTTQGFLPTWMARLLLDDPPAFYATRTHIQITEDSHMAVVRDEVERRADLFPQPIKSYIDTDVFRNAVTQFQNGVEELDAPSRPYSAKEHVDAEKIYESHNLLRSLSRQIRDDILARNMDDARRKTGNALHIVQDFYSHTNWIELGNNLPNVQFGSDLYDSIDFTAGPGDQTCFDCIIDPGREQDCVGNSDPADQQNRLTSGYFAEATLAAQETNTLTKPWGKCSHGGPSDSMSQQSPVGGINKDTMKPSWSPHSRQHSQAVQLAATASVNYIKNIRDLADVSSPISDQEFHEFLGLVTDWTLCFVVDTTGSMSTEIAAVRETTIKVVNSSSASARKPGDYVLVPFNDPGYGPVYQTRNPQQMIVWLSALTATGGGDEPELAMHGMQLAAGAARPSSTCYVYTDASAKDQVLYPVVKTLAIQNKVKFTFMLTTLGTTERTQQLQETQQQQQQQQRRRRRRSLSRKKRSPYPYYDDLAKSTGGSVLELRKSAVANATEAVVAVGSREQQVTVFIADSSSTQFQFYVDISLNSIVLQLSGSSAVTSIRTPEGLTFTNYTVLTDTVSAKIYSLGKLAPGLWSVTLSTGAQTVLVTASSTVNFDYQFTVDVGSSHGGFMEIDGIPVADISYYILTTLYGATDRSSGASTNLVTNITSLTFVSLNGLPLVTQPLLELVPMEGYVSNTIQTPRQAFRVALTGFDSYGNVFQRYDQSVVTSALTSVSLDLNGNSTLTMSPGASLNVCVTVTNNGVPATWYIRITDTESYYRGSSPLTVYLNSNQSQSACLTFSAPLSATFGTVSTVTVTVGGSSVTSVDNYLVFYITTDDIFPPTINVTDIEPVDDCALESYCDARNWSVQVRVQDKDSGLQRIFAQPVSTSNGGAVANVSFTFDVDPFDVGTKALTVGTYSTSCCSTTTLLRAVDVTGNVNEIVIGKPIEFVTVTFTTRTTTMRFNNPIPTRPTH